MLSDIGTGITELPRAVVKGARDAAQETMQFGADAAGMATGTDIKAPELPDLAAPKSITGGLAKSVSQFVVGMIGVGKITKPIQAVGRAAKAIKNIGQAATVGAVAFDPSGERLSDIVEDHLPILSNPVTQYLQANPGDSRALGRAKNAMESIGMDVGIIGTFVASTRLFKVMQDFKAGKAKQADVDKALAEAQAAEVKAQETANAIPEDASTPAAPEALPLQDKPGVRVDAGVPETPPAQAADGGASPRGDMPEAQTGAAPEVAVSDVVKPPTRVDALPSDAPPGPKLIEVTQQQTQALLKSMQDDAKAVTDAGSWEAAVNNGHRFGKGDGIPWQKLASEPDSPGTNPVEALIARMADELEAPLNAAKGGNKEGVMRDAQVARMIAQRAKLWGDDPAALMGLLETAGKNSKSMAANMEAAFLVGQRAVQDFHAAGQLVQAGDLSRWGGDLQAAAKDMRIMLSVASTAFGHGQAMRASAGRSLRRMRAEFAPSPADIEKLAALDPMQLAEAAVATGGNAKSMKALPSLLQRAVLDPAQWLLVNNLLWSWRTHFVNFSTNAYMIGGRPVERILGSYAISGDAGARIRAENWRQYTEMGSALTDAFGAAVQAFKQGDSVMSPHRVETFERGINAAQFNFKPATSLSNVMYNALVVPSVKALGLPTRALGAVDELTQQIVYRSKIASRAHVEGVERGLSGQALSDHVDDAVRAAFDESGYAINGDVLQEARTASFQQDLIAGTQGARVQNFVADNALARVVLPFIKTPVNVFRYGVKLTPGLNLVQTEYRDMIRGLRGPEAQAQAVGQMSVGSLFMAVAGLHASSGFITGGGPTKPDVRKALTDTGWQPYSFVVPNKDGSKTYIPFNRYDPIAMPFGIIADIVDATKLAEGDDTTERVTEAATAALVGIVKQMGDKTFLRSLKATIDAYSDPDRSWGKWARQTGTNYIPFSSGLRMANPDPYQREARDFVDSIMATLPGYSTKLPPKRDAFGDPLLVNKGLWSTGAGDLVDREIERMAASTGNYIGSPNPNIDGVDLRDIELKDGRNAYDVYQQLAARPSPNAKPLKDIVGQIMKTTAYKRAPDGDADTKGTKLYMLSDILRRYRGSALRRIKADPNVREELGAKAAKARAAYTSATSPKTPQQAGAQGLVNIGRTFGVDVEGVLPQQ